eukprot:gene5589-6956_t
MDETIELQRREICEKYQYPEQLPEEMVAVALQTIGKFPIYGTRIPLSKGDNISWFIYCGKYSDDEDFYQPLHTHHLSTTLPQVLKYLSLPTHSNFIIDNEGYEDVWLESGDGDEDDDDDNDNESDN